MNNIIVIAFFSLFFHTACGQERLYKILKEYMPYLPFEKNADSLFMYYASDKDFTADSISPSYLRGEFKNFNPPELQPGKIIIAVNHYQDNSLFYVVRI